MKEAEKEPVYTQEMFDNGELPPVGCMCECKRIIKNDSFYNSCYILGNSKDGEWLVFENYSGNIQSHNKKDGVFRFRPTDTRTDEDKAVDDMRFAAFERDDFSDVHPIEAALKAIKEDKIHGVKWVGKS